MADDQRPPFTTALLLARGCPSDLVETAMSWLTARQIPDDPHAMIEQVDEAIAVARSWDGYP